jgi:predicted nucleotide-binding protein
MLGVSLDMAEELLAEHVEQGQALIDRASFVGDLRDYENWKAARGQWIARTAETLAQIYPESDEVERFQNAAASPGGGRWQMGYTRDLECARVAIDVVVSLRDELERSREPTDGSGAEEERSHPAELRPLPRPEPQPAQEDLQPAQEELQPARQESQPGAREETQLAGEESQLAAQESQPAGEESHMLQGGELVAKSPNGSASTMPSTTSGGAKLDRSREVFLVHGRNETVRQAVGQLLGRAGSHAVTILNERPNDRKMLVEQFEPRAAGSRYAIVLLTADDVGAPRLDSEQEPYYAPRARQGVVFEMGFLVAALSPRCVCVLYEDGVELPFDLEGISYIRLDLSGSWQSKLLLLLRGAGFDYDLNSLATT